MNKVYKIISLSLSFILLFLICSCNVDVPENSDNNDNSNNSEQIEKPNDNGDNKTEIEESSKKLLSLDYKDYIGDIETFVYGLMINQLKYLYNVFPACVYVSEGYFVYGLAYTDFLECYTNEDETIEYYYSGFLPFNGELEVSDEDFNSGLYIHDLEYEDPSIKFIWKYKSGSFIDHCVVYDSYVKYGISENGAIFYEEMKYSKECVDVSIGSLYFYDDSRYLYDTNFGEYLPIGGISLYEKIDYVKYEEEINAYIEEQSKNFKEFDVVSAAHNSQSAVKAFLLSLQEETFLGYDVKQLVTLVENLNPMECYRITADGLSVIDIQENPEEGASALTKWLVGTGCVVVTIAGIICSAFTSTIPGANAAIGAITGAAMEILMQVVLENNSLENISWTKVAVAAASGAISGLVGSYLQNLSKASFFIIDSLVDGLIGGIEQFTLSLIDGESGKVALENFGMGFLIGTTISAGIKAIGKVIQPVIKKISKSVNEGFEKIMKKLKNTVSEFDESASDFGNSIGKQANKLKNKTVSADFENASINKIDQGKRASDILNNQDKKLFDKSMRSFSSKQEFFDAEGNYLGKKKEIYSLLLNSNDSDPKIYTYVKCNGELVSLRVKKINSCIEVFSEVPDKYGKTITLTNGLTSNRNTNFRAASDKLIEELSDPSSNMNAELKDHLTKSLMKDFPGENLEDILKKDRNMLSKKLVDYVKKSKWVFHESVDGKTIMVIYRELHDKVNGYNGVSHMGIIGFLKYCKSEIGINNFNDLLLLTAK